MERPVLITLSEPRLAPGNLETKCKEIVNEGDEALRSQQDFYQPEDNTMS